MGLLEKITKSCTACAFRKCCDFTTLEREQMKALHENLAKDVCLYEAFTTLRLALLGDEDVLREISKYTLTEVLEDYFCETLKARLEKINLHECEPIQVVKIMRIYLSLADMTFSKTRRKHLQDVIKAKFTDESGIFCKKTDIK